MKSLLKSLSFRTIAASGLPHRLHGYLNKGQLSILMYHGIVDEKLSLPDWCFLDTSSFRAQMKYLKKHFKVVSLTEAVYLLNTGKLMTPTAVITFDDGYQNNYDCAFPILYEENLPATIFLTSSLINTDLTIWTGVLHNAFSNTENATFKWRGTSFNLKSIQNKQRALATVKADLKKEPYSVLKNEMGKIVSELINSDTSRIDESSPYKILDSKSIQKMADSNLIDFGAHTHTHPILANLSRQEQESEILKSIEIVKSVTAQSCTLFAYPNGGKSDYNDDTISILEKSDIEATVSTNEGTCSSKTPIMELNRFGIGADMNMVTFKLVVHNIINRLKTIS